MKKTTLLLALTTWVCNLTVARHACLWAALGLLAALAFGPPPASAAVTEAWVHRYSNVVSNSNDQAVMVVRDAVGDIIVAGTTDDGITGGDMLTIKYSGADGSVLWLNRYNGPANRSDFARAVAVDGSGNVVVTGYSYNTNGNTDYYTAKYAAADGALLWEQHYNGLNGYDEAQAVAVDGSGNVVVTGNSATIKYLADGTGVWTNNVGGTALAVDGNGNVVVTGTSYDGTNFDYYTAKYAVANGALLWEKRYNGPANRDDVARAVAVDGSGNVVVTGYSEGDVYTAKYAAADGVLLWEKRYNGQANFGDEAFAVAVDGNGNVVVTGASADTNYNYDYYTAKYAAADGALLWEHRYNGPANDRDVAQAVAVDGSGNVVVSGYSSNGTNGDCYTAKYAAADGALLWEHRYNGPANSEDQANAVVVDGSGNVVVTGSSIGTNGGSDYYTAKYAATDGALLWEKRYNGPANYHGSGTAVVVDGSGNVVVTGASATGPSGGQDEDSFFYDYYTAKYAAANGALLWEHRYNGPGYSYDNYDLARAVAVDGTGNVVVTGNSSGTNGYGNYYTAKYAAGDGALLWERRYQSIVNYWDSPAVAVDGSGNVVVTGSSWNGTNGSDYYTAKYAAADGALLWEKRYNGPANRDNVAQAVAVDGSGNVLVTGYSYNTNGNTDYYTAKYAAADGALLWEKRYNGPANSYNEANALVVDGSGNVVVTGSSQNANGNTDYYTAKYAAADGALLWEQHYNGLNGYDEAHAVAVDGNGNVVVTGASADTNYNYDYYTAKYAAADGALLWEKRYNGPANGYDYASSLALGPNGMVAVTGSSSGDYATVVYRDDVYPISIALLPTGVRLRFIGIPGRSYTIERAPAVTGPWTSLNTQTAPASGLLEYLDTTPSLSQAFYRTVQP